MNVDFVLEQDQLYLLQCRPAKLSATAALHIAVSMVQEQSITEREALMRVDPDQMSLFLRPMVDPETVDTDETHDKIVGYGQPASVGAATGRLVFTTAAARECAHKGEPYIVCRADASITDFQGFKV
jgi:pyruvate,orthophosphate dikinase